MRQPAVVTVLFCAALASTALAQPLISANPQAGPPTDKVAVRGTGFSADEAVDIYFDTTDLALAATSPAGAFSSVSISVPASAAPGTHWITGVGRMSGLAAQRAFLVRTDWAQFLRDPEHRGYNPTENLLSVSDVKGLQLLWRASTKGNNSSPVLAKGVIYVESQSRYLYAFDALTGRRLWVAPTGDKTYHIQPTPAVANDVVYAGSYDGLYAFDAATGKLRWTALPDGSIESLTVANGVVYEAGDGLEAFHALTGQPIWTASNISAIFSAPAVQNGVAYVGSDDGSVYALNAATGQQIWQSANTLGSIFGSVTVENGIVYTQSYDGFFAYNAANGQSLWNAYVGSTVSSSPAVANGVVYEGPDAFNAVSGVPRWDLSSSLGGVYSTAAVANGVVYLGTNSSTVVGIDASNGTVLWTAVTDGPVATALVVANGVLYATSPGSVYAFHLPRANVAASQADPTALEPDLSLSLQNASAL
ncbi:MAG TPA: PQQ-binding-like beta-propeller repeat protein [Bryobacteraceae bacterium]|nr:PQQ-binding-like beta-propeller repeat protein [Bryobacteraceae bacterium]